MHVIMSKDETVPTTPFFLMLLMLKGKSGKINVLPLLHFSSDENVKFHHFLYKEKCKHAMANILMDSPFFKSSF